MMMKSGTFTQFCYFHFDLHGYHAVLCFAVDLDLMCYIVHLSFACGRVRWVG